MRLFVLLVVAVMAAITSAMTDTSRYKPCDPTGRYSCYNNQALGDQRLYNGGRQNTDSGSGNTIIGKSNRQSGNISQVALCEYAVIMAVIMYFK